MQPFFFIFIKDANNSEAHCRYIKIGFIQLWNPDTTDTTVE